MRRHAILIANSTFPETDGELGKLQTVPQDLDNVKSILRDLRGRFELTVLSEMEAPEILGTMDRVLRDVGERDLVLIYYAGHGRILASNPKSDRLLLATLSSKPQPNPDDDLPFRQIETQLVSRRIRRALIVLDCCYSGAVQSEMEVRSGAGAAQLELLPFDMKQYQSVNMPTQTGMDVDALDPSHAPSDSDQPDSDDSATQDSDPNDAEALKEAGLYVMTACTATQVAMGNRTTGSGEFTRHFIQSLKDARTQATEPITLKSVFTRVRQAMDQSAQTPMLICRNGTGDLTLARKEQYGEGKKRTLLNWTPLPKEVTDSSLSMCPVYILDSGFRFVHWNVIFEDVIAKQIGLVLGAHALEFIEYLDNKAAVLNRNPRFFPVPNAAQLAKADESGLIWNGFPLTDVERLEFRSDRFKLLVFDKQAYQLPAADFGARKYWHVQLNVQYAQCRKLFWENTRKLLETQDMWNEYADSYDNVISTYPTYQSLVNEMAQAVDGKTECLDVGSGTGNMLMALLKDPKRRVTAIEINDTMLQRSLSEIAKLNLKKRATLLRGDAKTILERMTRERGDKAEIFDCCTMLNVLYALDEPVEYLKAIHHVLKPGGMLVLSTPHASSGSELSDLFDKIQAHHASEGKWPELEKPWVSARRINEKLCEKELCTADGIRQMLREAKFEVDSADMQKCFEGSVLLAIARKPEKIVLNNKPPSKISEQILVTPPLTPIDGKRKVNIFVSYSRDDLGITEEFLPSLKRQLKPARKFQFEFFKDDENILVGQNWREQIDKALRDCDVGLLLLSPGFLGSEFIVGTELVQLFESKKLIVPVLLDEVDPELHDLKGLENKQIFRLDVNRDGCAYTRCDPQQKREFIKKLFEKMAARLQEAI